MPEDLADEFDNYYRIRIDKSPSRASNYAYRKAFSESTGDFIIVSHPEILIPYDGVERMVAECDMTRRNVATQYHLTCEAVQELFRSHVYPTWAYDFDNIKKVHGFWAIQTPWLYPNSISHRYRNHFTFSGSTRERFEEYMIPATDEWGMEDGWVHKRELENNEPSLPIEIEVYHQEHDRVYGTIPEYSVRMRRIRNSRL